MVPEISKSVKSAPEFVMPTPDAILSEPVCFDSTVSATVAMRRPDRYQRPFSRARERPPERPAGSRLSYCRASSGSAVRSASRELRDFVLALDADSGKLIAEPSLSARGLLRFAVTKGGNPPVLPGQPAITVGGYVAFNANGKSQRHSGCSPIARASLPLLRW